MIIIIDHHHAYIYSYCVLRAIIERSFSFHETHARSPRGGLTMGRTAEGRYELAKVVNRFGFGLIG